MVGVEINRLVERTIEIGTRDTGIRPGARLFRLHTEFADCCEWASLSIRVSREVRKSAAKSTQRSHSRFIPEAHFLHHLPSGVYPWEPGIPIGIGRA
jgi:hypothetical protein